MRQHLQAAWLLLVLAAGLGSAKGDGELGQPAGQCYSSQVSSANATVDYTKTAGPSETTFTFLVQPKTALTRFAVRINNALASNPSLILGARPDGTLQSDFTSTGGPSYSWPVGASQVQSFSITVAASGGVSNTSQLTDLCQQNLVITDSGGATVFTQPPYESGQAGSCILYEESAAGCGFTLLTDKEGFEADLKLPVAGNPPASSPASLPLVPGALPVTSPPAEAPAIGLLPPGAAPPPAPLAGSPPQFAPPVFTILAPPPGTLPSAAAPVSGSVPPVASPASTLPITLPSPASQPPEPLPNMGTPPLPPLGEVPPSLPPSASPPGQVTSALGANVGGPQGGGLPMPSTPPSASTPSGATSLAGAATREAAGPTAPVVASGPGSPASSGSSPPLESGTAGTEGTAALPSGPVSSSSVPTGSETLGSSNVPGALGGQPVVVAQSPAQVASALAAAAAAVAAGGLAQGSLAPPPGNAVGTGGDGIVGPTAGLPSSTPSSGSGTPAAAAGTSPPPRSQASEVPTAGRPSTAPPDSTVSASPPAPLQVTVSGARTPVGLGAGGGSTPPGTQVGSGACSAVWSISSSWSASNGTQSASLNLYLQSSGPGDIPVPYTITASNPAWTGLVTSWNFVAENFAAGVLTGKTESTNTWETLLAMSKNTVNVGAIVQAASSASFGPTSLSINGTPCMLSG